MQVLDRGEKIELLVDKTDNLSSQVCKLPCSFSSRGEHRHSLLHKLFGVDSTMCTLIYHEMQFMLAMIMFELQDKINLMQVEAYT